MEYTEIYTFIYVINSVIRGALNKMKEVKFEHICKLNRTRIWTPAEYDREVIKVMMYQHHMQKQPTESRDQNS